MATGGYSSVQLDDDDEDSEFIFSQEPAATTDNLRFQEFQHDEMLVKSLEDNQKSSGQGGGRGTNPAFVPDDDDISDGDDDKAELLSGEKKSPPFWTFEYYQTFFDVDTAQVLRRVVFSAVPTYKSNFLLNKIRPNADLYGPFWVCATLVFTIAVGGNLASYFASQGGSQWVYEFHKVTLAACAIFTYAWLVPALLWSFLIWRGNLAGFSFLEIVCVYGYSLSVFIPISMLWSVPVDWLRWLLVLVGVLLSGSVLLLTFWRALEDDDRKVAIVAMVIIFLLHAALAIGFKLYFFRAAHAIDAQLKTTPTGTMTTHARTTAAWYTTTRSNPATG